MAEKKRQRSVFRRREQRKVFNNKNTEALISDIDKTMKDLYSDSYFSTRNNLDNLNLVTDKMEDNINDIINRNSQGYNDVTGITKIYSKLLMRQRKDETKYAGHVKN